MIGPEGKALIGDDDISLNEYDSVISNFKVSKSGQYTLVISHAEGGSNGTLNVDIDVTERAPMSVADFDGYGCGH